MHVSFANDVALERATEPIAAWRTWALTGKRDGSHLRLRPIAGRTRPWLPMAPAEAACKQARLHAAPNIDCSCGLHATHELDILRRAKSPAVLGRVALWGRVIEHELGYRAQFGYPQRLALVCFLCFWQWGTARCEPDIVGYYGRGYLMPLCLPHLELAIRYSMEPAAVLDATVVDQRLRNTYAVDALAF
jgi:hypothetical protein